MEARGTRAAAGDCHDLRPVGAVEVIEHDEEVGIAFGSFVASCQGAEHDDLKGLGSFDHVADYLRQPLAHRSAVPPAIKELHLVCARRHGFSLPLSELRTDATRAVAGSRRRVTCSTPSGRKSFGSISLRSSVISARRRYAAAALSGCGCFLNDPRSRRLCQPLCVWSGHRLGATCVLTLGYDRRC